MTRKTYNLLFPVVLILADFGAVLVAFLSAYYLRFYSPLTAVFPVTKGFPPVSLYIYSFAFVGLVFIATFALQGAYKSSRPRFFSDQLFMIFKAVSTGLVLVMAFSFFYRSNTFSRLTLVLMWLCSLIVISLLRLILSRLESHLNKRGMGARRTVVVGLPETAAGLARQLFNQPQLGYQIVGTVSPEENKSAEKNSLGNLSDLPEIISNHKIDLVLMSLPLQYHQKMLEMVIKCDELNVEFQIAPDLLELMTLKARLVSINGTHFVSLGKTPLEGWNWVLKRTLDIIYSAIGLVILSPLLLLLAILVKLNSSGPILFRQERLGRDGRKFNLIKFRSMKIDAEDTSGPVRATPDDDRRTSVGKFLRRTSLDELPQLWNVLKGDMSLVGPRPERAFFVDKFKGDIPRYFVRHRVKSGMTGWAQVNGLRGDTSIEERTKYDLYYVENWSIGLDIKIILLTVRAMLKQENAY
ncbi:MAG: undecaprenyl-phosphate glucose phosphotransferase [candidate division Zixibacteria bacterium]|nr:undecaprenyl-phosphate glucose phosphotransferase [candidate division Zixibacteria bacterium]